MTKNNVFPSDASDNLLYHSVGEFSNLTGRAVCIISVRQHVSDSSSTELK